MTGKPSISTGKADANLQRVSPRVPASTAPDMFNWRHSQNVFAFWGKVGLIRRMGSTRCQRDCDGGCGRQSEYRGGHACCRSLPERIPCTTPDFLPGDYYFWRVCICPEGLRCRSAEAAAAGEQGQQVTAAEEELLHSAPTVDTNSGGYNSGHIERLFDAAKSEPAKYGLGHLPSGSG